MEEDERKKKLRAGKEKLAAFQKKKSKKKKSKVAAGGEGPEGEYTGADLTDTSSINSADLSSSSDVPYYDSDQQSTNGDDGAREDTRTLLKTQVALRSAQDRIEELEEALHGKQLALDNVISENTKLKSKLDNTKIPELEHTISKQDEAIQQLSVELQNLRGDGSQSNHAAEAQYLTEQVQKLQVQIQNAGKLLEIQAGKHSISTEALQRAKTEILSLQKIILEKDDILNQLSEKVNLMSKEYQNLKQDLETSKHNESVLSNELQTRHNQSEEIQNLKFALEESQKQEKEMKDLMAVHNAQMEEKLNNSAMEKEIEIAQIKAELEQFCLSKDELNADILRKNKEYECLLQQFNESEEEKKEIASELEQMKQNLDKAAQDVDIAKSQNNFPEENTEFTQLNQMLKQKTLDFDELQTKLSQSLKENERLVQSMNDKEQVVLKLEELQENYSQLTEKLKEYEEKLQNRDNKVAMNDVVTETVVLQEKMTPLSTMAQQQIVSKEGDADDSSIKIKDLEHRIFELEGQLKDRSESKIKYLEEENITLTKHVKTCEEKIAALECGLTERDDIKVDNIAIFKDSEQSQTLKDTSINESDQELAMLKESYSKMSVLLNESEEKIQSLEKELEEKKFDTADIHLIKEDNARISELLVVYEEKIEMLERKLQDKSEEVELNLLREDNTKMSELLQVDEEKIHNLEEKLHEIPSEEDIERVKKDYPKLAEILKVYEEKTYSLQLQLQEKCDMEELNFLQEDNYRMSELLKVYEEKIQSLEQELQGAPEEAVVNKLREEVSKTTETIKNYEEKIMDYEEQLLQNVKEKEQLALELDQLNEEYEQVSQQLKLQDAQLKESQNVAVQLASMQQEYHFYRNQNDELKNKINIQQDAVMSQKSQLELLLEEHSLVKEQISVSQQELESVTIQFNNASEDKILYLNQVKTLANELAESKIDIEKYSEIMKNYEYEIQNSRSEVELYKGKNYNLEEDIESLRLELERSKIENEEVLKSLKINLQELEKEGQNAEDKLSELQSMNQQYSDELGEKEILIDSLKLDLQEALTQKSKQEVIPKAKAENEFNDVDWSFSTSDQENPEWTSKQSEITEEKMEAIVEQFVCTTASELEVKQSYDDIDNSREECDQPVSESLRSPDKKESSHKSVFDEKEITRTISISTENDFGYEELQKLKSQIVKMEQENEETKVKVQLKAEFSFPMDILAMKDSVNVLEEERKSLVDKLQSTLEERDKLLKVISTLTEQQQISDRLKENERQIQGQHGKSDGHQQMRDSPLTMDEDDSHHERVRKCMQAFNGQQLVCQSSSSKEGSACVFDNQVVDQGPLQSFGEDTDSGDFDVCDNSETDTFDIESGDMKKENFSEQLNNQNSEIGQREVDKSSIGERLILLDAMENVSSLYEKQKTEKDNIILERDKLKKDLDIFKVSVSELQEKHELVQDENEDLLCSIEKLKAEYQDLKTSFENLQDHYDMLGDDNHTLKLEYDQLQDKFNDLTVENETLTKNLNDSDVLSSKIYSESAELLSRLNELEDVNANLDENLSVSSDKICELEQENQSLKSSLSDTKEKLGIEIDSNEKLKKEVTSLLTELGSLELKSEESVKRIQDLEEEKLRRQEFLNKAESLQAEKEKLQNDNENLKSQIRMLNLERNEKAREIDTIQQKVTKSEKESDEIRSAFVNKIKTLEEENLKLVKDNESFKQEIQKCNVGDDITLSVHNKDLSVGPRQEVVEQVEVQLSEHKFESQVENVPYDTENVQFVEDNMKIQQNSDTDIDANNDLKNKLESMENENVQLKNETEDQREEILCLERKSCQLLQRIKQREENLEIVLTENEILQHEINVFKKQATNQSVDVNNETLKQLIDENIKLKEKLVRNDKEICELKLELCKEVESRMQEKSQSIDHLKHDISELRAHISNKEIKPESKVDKSLTLPLENLHKSLENISQSMAESCQIIGDSDIVQEDFVAVTLGVPLSTMNVFEEMLDKTTAELGNSTHTANKSEDKSPQHDSERKESDIGVSLIVENLELKKRNETLTDKIQLIEQEKSSLKLQLKESMTGRSSEEENQMAEILEENSQLMDEIESINKNVVELKETKIKLDALEVENDRLRNEILICSQNDKLVEGYKTLQDENRALQEMLEKKQSQAVCFEDKILQLVSANQKMKMEAMELHHEMRQTRDKMLERTETLEQFLQVNKLMNDEVSELKQELASFSDSRSSLDETLSFVESAVNTTTHQVKELEEKYQSFGIAEIERPKEQTLTNDVESLKSESKPINTETKFQMKELNEENESLKLQLRSMEEMLNSQTETLVVNDDKISSESVNTANSKDIDILEEMARNLEDIQREKNAALEEIEQLKKMQNKKLEENAELAQKIKVLVEENDKLQENQCNLEKIKRERDELLAVHEGMADEFCEMKSKYESVRSLMEDTKKECNREIDKLRNQLSSVNKDMFSLKGSLEVLESDLNASADQKLQLMASLEEEQSRRQEIVAEQQRLQELNEKFNKDLQNQRKANETLLNNLADSNLSCTDIDDSSALWTTANETLQCSSGLAHDAATQTDLDVVYATAAVAELLKEYEAQVDQLSNELEEYKSEYEVLKSLHHIETGQLQSRIDHILDSSYSNSVQEENLSNSDNKEDEPINCGKESLSQSVFPSEKDIDYGEGKDHESMGELKQVNDDIHLDQNTNALDTSEISELQENPETSELNNDISCDVNSEMYKHIEQTVKKQYDKKLEQMEYEMEEQFEMEFRDKKLDLMVQLDKEKKNVAESLQQAAKQKLAFIQAERHQDFVQALQKMKKDFGKKLQFELEKQKLKLLSEIDGQKGDVVQKLHNDNQDLEKAKDELMQQVEQLQTQLLDLKGQPETDVKSDSCFIQENEDGDSSAVGNPVCHNESVVLDWEFSPFDYDGDSAPYTSAFDISCQRPECQHLLQKYKELSDQISNIGFEPSGSLSREHSFDSSDDTEIVQGFEPEDSTPTTELEESFIKETFSRAAQGRPLSTPPTESVNAKDSERSVRALSLGPLADQEMFEEGFIAEIGEKESTQIKIGRSHSLDESHFTAECVERHPHPKSAPIRDHEACIHDEDEEVFIGEGFIPNEATDVGILAIDKLKQTAKSKMKEKSRTPTLKLTHEPTVIEPTIEKIESAECQTVNNEQLNRLKADLKVKEHEISFLENKIESLLEFSNKEKHSMIEKCRNLSVQIESEVLSRQQLEQELVSLTDNLSDSLRLKKNEFSVPGGIHEDFVSPPESSMEVKRNIDANSSDYDLGVSLSSVQKQNTDLPKDGSGDTTDSENLSKESNDENMSHKLEEKISSLELEKAALQTKLQRAFDIFEKEKHKLIDKNRNTEIELENQVLSRKNIEEELESLRKSSLGMTLPKPMVSISCQTTDQSHHISDSGMTVTNLNQEINELKKNLLLKNSEIESLKEQVNKQSEALKDSNREVVSLNQKVHNVILELQEKEKLYDELDKQGNMNLQQLAECKVMYESNMQKIKEEKDEEIEVLKENIKDKINQEETCKNLESKVTELQRSLKEKESVVKELENSIEELNNELMRLEASSAKNLEDCKAQMENVLSEKDVFIDKQKKDREMENEIMKKNQKHILELESHIKKTTEKLKQQEDILNQNENEITYLKKCNQEMGQVLKENENKIAILKGNSNIVSEENYKNPVNFEEKATEEVFVKSEYDKKIGDLQCRLTEMEKSISEKEQNMTVMLQEKEEQIQKLKCDLERLSDIESKYDKSLQEISGYKSEMKEKDEADKPTAEKVSELKIVLSEKESYINKLEDEVDMLNSDLERLSGSQNSEERYKNLKESMEKTLKEKDSYIKKLEEHLLGQPQSVMDSSTSTPVQSPRVSLRGTTQRSSENSDKSRTVIKHSKLGIQGKGPLLPWKSPLDDFSDHSTICSASSSPRTESTERVSVEREQVYLPEWHSRSSTPLSHSSTIDSSDRIVSGLDQEEDGHVALEHKHFELVSEISELRKDLRETKAIYTQENALLQEALDRERWMKNSMQSKLGMTGTVVKFDLSAEVISLRQKVSVLQETNKMLRIENDRWLTRIQDQERLVMKLKEQIGEEESSDEDVDKLFSKQVVLLQKQREDLLQKLKIQESENTRLSEKLSDKTVLEENLRREKDLLKVKLQEKEDIEMELWQKRTELERQMEMQRKLEEILYHKNQIEKELMKQKRLLELDLSEIEAKLQEKEELLHIQKHQLLREIKEKDQMMIFGNNVYTEARAKHSVIEPTKSNYKLHSHTSDKSPRVIGRLEIQLSDAEKQHIEAVETLKTKLKSDDSKSDQGDLSERQNDTVSPSDLQPQDKVHRTSSF